MTPEPTRTAGRGAVDIPAGGVPAVVRTIAILEHLADPANSPATATEIAKAIGINVSTCFNILKTLARAHYVAYEPRAKTYELGIGLRNLGDTVDRNDQVNRVARRAAQQLASATGLTVFLFRWTDESEFIVTDKVEANRKFRITTSVGQRFPWDAAILAKTYFAWQPRTVVDRLVDGMPLVPRAPNTITNPNRFRRELAVVRQRGYATSIGEYQPELNAVAAAIFAANGEVHSILVASSFAFEFGPDVMRKVGPQVLDVATTVTRSIGGRYPDLDA
jgi:DNA-binding IclR family transcriptional regulator